MKKIFEKPALCRCEIRLNENIALSWEYYMHGDMKNVFHFTYKLEEWVEAQQDKGCYELYVNNPNWTTGENGAYGTWFYDYGHNKFGNINSINAMIEWMNDLDTYNPGSGCVSHF